MDSSKSRSALAAKVAKAARATQSAKDAGASQRVRLKAIAAGARALRRRSRIALAMAGGGPLGAIYEIGALAALAESLEGIDFNRLDIYVGVSAGGILGAGLANGITPREMCRMFIDAASGAEDDATRVEPFDPAMLMRPALAQYWTGLRKLPPLAMQAAWRYVTAGRGKGLGAMLAATEHLLQAVPTGVFSNEPLRKFLAQVFSQPGRTDDFRALKANLYLIATDLDSGKSVEFGAPGHDAIPISLAATASSALPGLFPPVEINGRHYVDGALKRTLHASVALKEDADLVLCLNPLVPYDDQAVIDSGGRARRLIDGGLPIVLLQTIRAVIHSRMEIGMRQYGDDYPHADVLLFEPNRADAEMFFTNMFSYSSRRRLCEHAYQKTRAELWKRRHELAALLERHGVVLNLAVLRDRSRTLVDGVDKPQRPAPLPVTGITDRLAETLDDLGRYVLQAREHQAARQRAPVARKKSGRAARAAAID